MPRKFLGFKRLSKSIFGRSNKITQLNAHLEKYIYKTEDYLLYYLKGYCLNIEGITSDSEIFLKKSLNLNKKFWLSYELLINIYNQKTKLIEMDEMIKTAKKLFPKKVRLSYFESLYLYRKNNFKKAYEILDNNNNYLFFKNNQNQSYLVEYYDLLSKICEKLKKYKKCIDYALRRNKILLNLEKNKKFSKTELLDTINIYIKFFDTKSKPDFVKKNLGLDHSNLTFLIGFPRSGTTLLDTILRSHSQTFVLEEKPYLLNVRHNYFKKNNISELFNLNENYKIEIQKQYFNSFNYDPNKITIDKFPLNLLELGFIKTIFPESKIILALRHPLDSILSCVLTSFKINEAMLNFENLKTDSCVLF